MFASHYALEVSSCKFVVNNIGLCYSDVVSGTGKICCYNDKFRLLESINTLSRRTVVYCVPGCIGNCKFFTSPMNSNGEAFLLICVFACAETV